MRLTYRYFPGGKTKALAMSYDDGFEYDRSLVEILNRYGIRGTFHLNASMLDQKERLRSDEIQSLFLGHEVASHGYSHVDLTVLPLSQAIEEVIRDRLTLESLTGTVVRGFSYPYGCYHPRLAEALTAAGIEYARLADSSGKFLAPTNFLRWTPTCRHRQGLLERLKSFLELPGWCCMPIMLVWGHSYEFERDGNWQLLDSFCQTVIAQEDIWFATMLELYDYLMALRAIHISADGSILQNPTTLPLWVEVDGEMLKLDAGSTIHLS